MLININSFINSLKIIHKNINQNIILIIILDEKTSFYYKNYTHNLLKLSISLIFCYKFNTDQWKEWVNKKINMLKLNINDDVKNILYKNYEGNLSKLLNTLKLFLILYPKKKITYEKIKNIIENVAKFSPEQWVDSILNNDQHRSIYIINRFMIQKYNPAFLIRALQKDLIILINIQRHPKNKYQFLFNKYKIYKNRQLIFINALKNSDNEKLYKMINILLNIEICIKKNIHIKNIWIKLITLSLIF